MPYDDNRAQKLRDDLESAIGHYMAAVAGQLLDEGLPVASISSFGAYDDRSQDAFGADVEGSVEFTRAFRGRLAGDNGDSGLLWCGVSGWCFFRMPEGSGLTLLESARWMGGGLVPQPRQVAAFLSEVQLDAPSAGSEERPFYRVPHKEPRGLLGRLRAFEALSASDESWHYDSRFSRLRSDAYRQRAVRALTAEKQELVDVAFHTGELRALMGLLEYVEGAAPGEEARELARRLASDLGMRARDGRESFSEHREAFGYAVEQRGA